MNTNRRNPPRKCKKKSNVKQHTPKPDNRERVTASTSVSGKNNSSNRLAEEISVTASPLKSMESGSNNPFISKVAIFDDMNFKDWNVRLMFASRKENLEEFIETSETERKYREGDDNE